jgi:aspartate/methionine/tyrosine aminotransferase
MPATIRPSSSIRQDIAALEPSGLARIFDLGRGVEGLIPLWLGETDLVTPKFIRDAAIAALEDGKTFYLNARGLPALRQAIADLHARSTGAGVEAARVTVPGSAMLAVVSALQCVAEGSNRSGGGDNIVIVAPIWPNIFNAAKVVGVEPRLVRLEEDWQAGRWHLDLERLFAACDARTRAFFLASPGNPTGWTLTGEQQREILAFARKHGIAIIADEVYGTLTYGGEAHAPSFLQVADPEDALFVIAGFSKPFAMTGWRMGWLLHPKSLENAFEVSAQTNNTGAASFLQYGALAALSPQGDAFRAELLARCARGRAVVDEFLSHQNRIRWLKPDGAFYGFLHIEGLRDSMAFAETLALKHRVGVSPGSSFGLGDARDEAYVRICFARDADNLAEGLRRIEQGVAGL